MCWLAEGAVSSAQETIGSRNVLVGGGSSKQCTGDDREQECAGWRSSAKMGSVIVQITK